MKSILIFLLGLFAQNLFGQVVLDADGPGNTYELITSVLAPNYNPIEVPDCNHMDFGKHIDELFDDDLDMNVFRFHIHTTTDNDRCINFDRQRNEIKAYDKSPDNLLGTENEKVVYNWKFKLDSGFLSSPNFTHLHQLKSVGGPLASMPIYTLTTRKGSPDRLELRYAETNSQITLKQTDLAPFINTWLDVTETIEYGINGTYEIVIKRTSDDSTLFSYTNNSIINWRPDAEFVRPKWGIYRSLLNAQDLRDETVRFANFSIEEVELTSTEDTDINNSIQVIYSNPVVNTLSITSPIKKISSIQLFSLDGNRILNKLIKPKNNVDLNVSSIPTGTYILNLKGKDYNSSKLILISG